MALGCALISSYAGAGFVGPVSPYYLDNYFPVTGTNGIYVVQGASLTSSFPTSAYGGENLTCFNQGNFAVTNTIHTSGLYALPTCNGYFGGEYTLAGTPTGNSYPAKALPAGLVDEQSYDGTSDGTHNYYVEYYGTSAFGTTTEDVYQTNANWQNPLRLFSVQSAPGASGEWVGIAFDQFNNSLWLSGWSVGRVADYSLTGQLLASFSAPAQLSALGFDPADHTLWALDSLTFQQYSTSGVLLQSGRPIPGLPPGSFLAGDFPVSSAVVPEPATLMLVGLGIAALAASARKSHQRIVATDLR